MHKIVEREDYFSAAIDILAEDDHGGLKITPLCRRLQVTSGSFYNYFGGWANFKTELLEFWLDDRTVQLAEAARRHEDAEQGMIALIEFSCGLPHRAEAAIRAWSHSDGEVLKIQSTVDEQRYRVTFDILERLLGDATDAEHRARLALFVTTGYQQVQPLPEVEHLRRSLHMVFADILPALA
ncbi:TetR/AcrR family transcriptional regulator [Mycolicibacterium thermoresistibile]|uniref:Transcriptional regulator n=2 Tax=Mycolicibacterium thermoresistibile TaxID=1797 RepID=G7CB01_MYCT3|nr:TetR/AcrR family transcriptional regulator [Mycolicibacterium thermoresistibile]EHI14855.1 transcriptional regulator [Mycolicibacterium thermoresistibile ATCC 19527]MCV7190824.1 TetR/AcrR family transcriptional regulator [Mycolicibacterium thermoresistibile]GAT16199.1 transcriptional regulator [Mycolicibacterium thermoresistibile]SNW18663.1 transcriptional regulator [Mycolicibacterium thermoresistibile]